MLLDCTPGLLPLCGSQLWVGDWCPVLEVGLTPFCESLVTERYEDGEQWLCENLLDVMDEEALKGS